MSLSPYFFCLFAPGNVYFSRHCIAKFANFYFLYGCSSGLANSIFFARCGPINSLHDAARENDLEEAKIFLSSGSNVIDRPRGIYGQTALHVASLNNSRQGILNHNPKQISKSMLVTKMKFCLCVCEYLVSSCGAFTG